MDVNAEFKFIIADDHAIVRQGVSFVLSQHFINATIYQMSAFSDIIKKINSETIDLIFLDINFPDGPSINIIPTIKKLQPNTKILIFSGLDENVYAIRYLNEGAHGFLSKLSSEEEVINAVISMIKSGKFVSENIQERIMDSYILKKPTNVLEQLSNREIEITKLLVEGYSNLEICDLLNIQKSTVSTYKNRIFEKLGVDNLPSLIKLFNLYSKPSP